MPAAPEASVAPWKRELVGDLIEKFEEYPTIGVLDISGIPARQFQQMRDLLRGRAEIKVGRRVLLRISVEKVSEDKPELEELIDYLEGPSALIFADMNPFKLWKLLDENRTSAPAKTGMESPKDIVIPEGETEFSPGPIVGELQRAGVNARIQAGKVVVLEDSKIVEEGESISEEEVGVLSRFGIEPREIGFELRGAYADGTVFSGDMLEVDEEKTLRNVQAAYMNSLKLSLGIQFPTEQNLRLMLGQATSKAHNLALNASIFTSKTASPIMSKAYSQMLNLASAVATENPEAIGEDLSTKLSSQASTEKTKKEEKSKEEAEEEKEETEEKEEKGEKTEEKEATAAMGSLFE